MESPMNTTRFAGTGCFFNCWFAAVIATELIPILQVDPRAPGRVHQAAVGAREVELLRQLRLRAWASANIPATKCRVDLSLEKSVREACRGGAPTRPSLRPGRALSNRSLRDVSNVVLLLRATCIYRLLVPILPGLAACSWQYTP